MWWASGHDPFIVHIYNNEKMLYFAGKRELISRCMRRLSFYNTPSPACMWARSNMLGTIDSHRRFQHI